MSVGTPVYLSKKGAQLYAVSFYTGEVELKIQTGIILRVKCIYCLLKRGKHETSNTIHNLYNP